MLKLLVIEDHALVREGMVQVLAQLEEDTVVNQAPDAVIALDMLEQDAEYDLILLDLALPNMSGFSALPVLRQRYPAVPVVVLSAYDDNASVQRAMRLGASGFVPKAANSERVLGALRQVLEGSVYTPDMTIPIPLPPEKPSTRRRVRPTDLGLTERQTQVLAYMVKGKSNREIGEELGLAEGTVKIHVTAILRTLQVSSRSQALIVAARYGWKL